MIVRLIYSNSKKKKNNFNETKFEFISNKINATSQPMDNNNMNKKASEFLF